jgi:prepilin-type N-terminal cleavage/methylation domain-containing protein
MMNKLKNGFTLVELIIAMVVGLVIMLAIYSMMDISQKSSSGVGRRVLTQQDSRAVLDLMAMEIGMASFNPNMDNSATGIWSKNALKTDGTACNTAPVPSPFVLARKGIQVATANSILVAMDLGGAEASDLVPKVPDNAIGGKRSSDNAPIENEYILYNYVAADGTITRAVSCGTAQTILGGTGSSTLIRNNLTNPVTPLFQYFNVAGTELVPPLTDANIGSIRRIRINIIADVETQQSNAFKTSRRTYSTDTLVRNHAF